MFPELYLFLAFLITGLAVVFYLLNRKLSEVAQKSGTDENLLRVIETLQRGTSDLQKGLRDQSQTISTTLQRSTQDLNKRLDNAAQVISQVQKNIGEMSEIGRGMKELQEFLRSPKLRGNIGEQVLKELLNQFLPKQSFSLQHSFRSGAKVDAAITTAAGIIPVDAKFPMENFRRMMEAETETEKKAARRELTKDVKKHIRDISQKYILTDEGTIDYALMYLPSESVYYEVVNSVELFDYSSKRRVLPVSPMTFYAYLRAILMSFEGQKIERRAKQILSAIRSVQRDYSELEGNLSTLGRHVQNAFNQMSNVMSGFTQLGQKITHARSLGQSHEQKAEQLKAAEE